MNQRQVQILDCSIRDGGYVNDWHFSPDLVREVYRAASKAGVDFVELGFRSSSKYFDPAKFGLWKFSSDQDLFQVTGKIRGAKIAIMGDYGRIDLEDLVDKKKSPIDVVRVAVHKTNVYDAIDFLEKVKAKGYIVSLQCMGYSVYEEAEKRELLDALKQTEMDYVYVADSYGSMFPFHVREVFEPFLELGGFKVGFHPHNNIQMAFANTLEAIRAGVHVVDTTIYGIGRGAGNLPTEILLSYLSTQGDDKYNVIPLLNCIERFFLDLKQKSPWGYQLPYMISGIFNSHPSYSKELLRRQEYSMEDIWKALGCVKELNPVGFKSDILDDLIRQGFIGAGATGSRNNGKTAGSVKSKDGIPPAYLNRYPDREFLVLANGPSLKKYQDQIRLFIDKYDPVVLGANYLGDLFIPHYHGFNNRKRFESYIKTVSPDSKLLIGTNLSKELVAEYTDRPYEDLVFRDVLDADFDIEDGVITSNCRTISVLLAGMAVVMGASRVFVAGMDGYLNANSVKSTLFYEEKFDPREHELNVERHRWNDIFLGQIDEYIRNQGGEGVHILTPTGHSAYYKSIENYL